jgi:hypothetical protein
MDWFQYDVARDETSALSAHEAPFPADFSADEAEFAADLRRHFEPTVEELPPHYAQALLGKPRGQPDDSAFEQQLSCRVFYSVRVPKRIRFVLIPARRPPKP